MCILECVRKYVMGYPFLKDGRINVDYLGQQPTEYSIDEVPVNPVLRTYLDGSVQKQFVFVFSSREPGGTDCTQALASHGFYEQLEKWLHEKNRLRIFPNLGEGRRAQRIETTTGGYVMTNKPDSARYEIRCRLIYFEEGMRF